jgi:hypothetical protein
MLGRTLTRVALGCLCSTTVAGCLGDTYYITRQELLRVAELPPQERGERLRVVQTMAWSGEDLDATAEVVLTDERVECHTHEHEVGPRQAQCGRRAPPAPPATSATSAKRDENAGKDAAEAALAVAVAVAVVAATGAIVVGATEGARFDGWVATRPHQSLLVVDRSGMRHWVSLSALTPDYLRNADHALVTDDGRDFEHLERAPLSRRGFVYQAELGAATLGSAPEVGGFGFAARGALGYMPSQNLGFLAGAQFATGSASGAAGSGPSVYLDDDVAIHYRMFLQSELWLLETGRLHAGPYLELGYARALEDTPVGTRSGQAPFAALGAALQLEWTTRLALSMRAGVAALPIAEPLARGESSARLAAELTLGVSIY